MPETIQELANLIDQRSAEQQARARAQEELDAKLLAASPKLTSLLHTTAINANETFRLKGRASQFSSIPIDRRQDEHSAWSLTLSHTPSRVDTRISLLKTGQVKVSGFPELIWLTQFDEAACRSLFVEIYRKATEPQPEVPAAAIPRIRSL